MKQTVFFQTLSDETRLRALVLMAGEGELCVCELVSALAIPQPKISRHMAAMREAEIVTARRHAQWVFYSIAEDLPGWKREVLKAAVAGARGEAIIEQDRQRLGAMKDRPERCPAA
jgi:ArsR family transcriptional regulator